MPTPGASNPAHRRAHVMRNAASVLLGVVAPFGTYQIATGLGASELAALAWGVVFPLAGIAIGLLSRRRLEPISTVSLVTILVGLTGGLLLHSAEFLLVKDSITSATIGLAFLGSLLASRPLIFVLGRSRSADPTADFDRRWAEPAFRRALRLLTAVWGGALLVEAVARVVLSLLVRPATLLLVSPLVTTAILGPVALWTFHRARTRTVALPPTAPTDLEETS